MDFDDFEMDDTLCDGCDQLMEDCKCGECGMMPGGQCTLAGSEYCMFDCPNNPTKPPVH